VRTTEGREEIDLNDCLAGFRDRDTTKQEPPYRSPSGRKRENEDLSILTAAQSAEYGRLGSANRTVVRAVLREGQLEEGLDEREQSSLAATDDQVWSNAELRPLLDGRKRWAHSEPLS
jgi:hypothetical protein